MCFINSEPNVTKAFIYNFIYVGAIDHKKNLRLEYYPEPQMN